MVHNLPQSHWPPFSREFFQVLIVRVTLWEITPHRSVPAKVSLISSCVFFPNPLFSYRDKRTHSSSWVNEWCNMNCTAQHHGPRVARTSQFAKRKEEKKSELCLMKEVFVMPSRAPFVPWCVFIYFAWQHQRNIKLLLTSHSWFCNFRSALLWMTKFFMQKHWD